MLTELKIYFKDFLPKRCWVASRQKHPINPHTGGSAKSNDPSTWGTYEEVSSFIKANYQNGSEKYLPALALNTDLGITAIDFDDVLDEQGNFIFPDIEEIVNSFDSYTEISSSGRGLHVFVKGNKPDNRRSTNSNSVIEMYDNKHFMTLTGNPFRDAKPIREQPDLIKSLYEKMFGSNTQEPKQPWIASPPMSDEEVIQKLRSAKNNKKFSALFDKGKIDAYSDDRSAADFALCNLIVFYTQDCSQIERLMRKSTLKRDKWDDHKTYLIEHTINKALSGLQTTYQASISSWESPEDIEEEESLELDFPTQELPQYLKEAVEEIARDSHVDPALVSLPGIGIAALMIGKKAVVVEKPGLKHPPSLFLVGVAPSGERKSSIYNSILIGIKDAISLEYTDYKKEKASVRTHNELIKEQVFEIKKQLKESKIERQDAQILIEELYASEKEFPPEPYNFGDDITEPRLFQKLYEHNGVYGVFSADARSIFKKILGTKDGESGEAIYLGGMWGDDLSRSRVGSNKGDVGGEDMLIRQPALTTVAFIQPDRWAALSKDSRMRDCGLISRINLVIPHSQMGTRFETAEDIPLDPRKIQPFTETILRIRKWKPAQQVDIPLSKEAAEARRKFYNEIEKELCAGGKFDDVKDIATKATSLACRIALIFAVLEAAENPAFDGKIPPISVEQFSRALAFQEYFLSQTIDSQRTHSRKGSAHILQKVAVWLKKQVNQQRDKESPLCLLASQISKGVRGTTTPEIEETIIPTLVKSNWLRLSATPKGTKQKYEVNPRIVES